MSGWAALADGAGVRDACEQLVASVKQHQGDLSVADARQLVALIREAEGWLQGARKLLDTEENW